MSRADHKEAMDIAFNKTQDMRLAARQMKREVMIRKSNGLRYFPE